ncbi:probable asparagine--tRNA ligase, mitochondrial isoform X2 [Venturia canescens]|nr:probable asparagine--tRNA ligase, mitochondrial isoform X2 [Venturia canescens]
MKENIFLDVDDGSSSQFLQIVMKKEDKPEDLSFGSSVSIEGELTFAPNGRPELHAEKIQLLGKCILDEGYPFAPRIKYSIDYVRQYLHLRARTRFFSSVMRLRDLAATSLGEHMKSRNFINVHTPILTSNDCEGAGEVFNVRPESIGLLKTMRKENTNLEDAYFNGKVFLTVSAQLHLEAMARALSKVYSFGPTFRAENSKSRLHLSEFYMMEAEMAFTTDINEIMLEAELLVKSMTKYLLEKGEGDMRSIGAPVPSWLESNFGIIDYNEAITILERNSDRLTVPVHHDEGLSKEHELFLVKHNNGIPIFIINWPKDMKPFYMKTCPNDSSKVAAMDLLVPEVGELFGGSLREDDYDVLKENLPPGLNLNWYLELRKFGNVPTGGFGMGFERFLQCVLGIPNIKDVIPFPRWPHNCTL